MIFPGDFEQRIGFDRIRAYLLDHCISPLGRALTVQMSFITDAGVILNRLKNNHEFLLLLRSGNAWPSAGYYDPSEYFKMARIEGSVLTAEAFTEIRRSLQTISEWLVFLESNKEDYPFLYSSCGGIILPAAVVREIDKKLEPEGRIRDNATPDLQRIRRMIAASEMEARKLIEQLFRQAVGQGFTPEGAAPVFRDGRVAIPVKAEFKRRIKGVIIDESATGQTIYIEPESLVEINNDIRDLTHEERREEVRILRALTAMLRLHISDLESAFEFLALMDFNAAKAKLSDVLDAQLPVLKSHPVLEWREARHPGLVLIRGKAQVVPMDMNLRPDGHFLLVSGPNAGGKSVCLKATGLLQYMVQCGLLPAAGGDSVFGIFSSLLIDIGDQQSIENDLSTYSSHLRNMSGFLAAAGNDALVLIDEMGAGTDPSFGGGIAEAVLTSLVRAGTWGVVTTHYANLKTLSERVPGILNGAMLFDAERLTPLFRLAIGKPGSSYAMELARKSGLPPAIIKDAEAIIGSGLVGLEALMRRTESEKVATEKLKTELASKDRQLREQLTRYEKLSAELEAKKKEIITRAKDEASALLRETNREIEKTIRHIRENKAEKKETKKVRQKLTELTEQVKAPATVKPTIKKSFKEGDRVRLVGQDQSGTVLQIKGKIISVQFGLMRSNVEADRLVHAQEQPVSNPTRIAGIDLAARRSTFKETLDIIGKRPEEVIPLLESYMDDAIMLGIPEVRIIHGKGTGVLRKLVRDIFSGNPSVTSIRDEHPDRGGAGITLMVLRS
ncbi:MAG: endonuclease MutS2 [Cyclobacteriaceae bacterium]